MLSLGLDDKIRFETFTFGFPGFPLTLDDVLGLDSSAQSLTVYKEIDKRHPTPGDEININALTTTKLHSENAKRVSGEFYC